MVTSKGAVVTLKCSFTTLVLQKFFQAINFHFTQTTENQPTRNLHSPTKLQACCDTCRQSLRNISFHHVQENTKIFACTWEANSQPFPCAMLCLSTFQSLSSKHLHTCTYTYILYWLVLTGLFKVNVTFTCYLCVLFQLLSNINFMEHFEVIILKKIALRDHLRLLCTFRPTIFLKFDFLVNELS